MAESKTGQITIIAKNINGKASGEIRDDAKSIKNETGGKFYQNGAKGGVVHDKNEGRKPVENPLDLKVVKVISEDKKIEINKLHRFTATEFNREAAGVELASVKWAYQFDDGKIQYCDLPGKGVAGKTEVTKDIYIGNVGTATKVRVYAFVKTPTKDASIEVQIVTMPKIIIVNGQWRVAKYTLGENVGPTKPKKPYWVNGFSKSARDYFQLHFKIKAKQKRNNLDLTEIELEKQNFILYYDGSSYAGLDQSGSDRFKNGKKFAEDNYLEIVNGLGKEAIYLVSHSEGGAYAAGIADFLFSKGHKIGEHVLLSPDEGDEFEINPSIPSYQLQYMFFSSVWNPGGTMINYEKSKIGNKGFRVWGKYYAIVDWVTNEFTVKGVKKSGISHEQEAGWSGVHGWTNGVQVFNRISDLKSVNTFDAIGEYNYKVYSGKQQTDVLNKTKFYKIDNEYIIFNCPPIIEIN